MVLDVHGGESVIQLYHSKRGTQPHTSKSMTMIEIYANGFVKVGEYTVGGMRRALNPSRDPVNDARPHCSCPDGFKETWCEHKKSAYDAMKAKG